MKLLLAIVSSLAILQFSKAQKWCAPELQCGGEKNLACENDGECSVDGPCASFDFDRDAIIKEHNELRNRFALGKEPAASSITVANMKALQWDEELAFGAACNLKKCTGQMKHDACRKLPTFSPFGQNLAMNAGSQTDYKCTYIDGVQDWYGEVKMLTEEEIKAMGKTYTHKEGTGHFTQLVWADTEFIGCAMVRKPKNGDKMTVCLLACDYGPGGNMIGAQFFKLGKPQSKCPPGHEPNPIYRGLCGGNNRAVKVNKSVAPTILLMWFLSVSI